jgi:ketosteroid isomerase-like protein
LQRLGDTAFVSQENVELVHEVTTVLNEEGVEAVLPYVHPDFEFSTPRQISLEPETYRGHEGLRRYFDQWSDAADRVRILLADVFDAGDAVVFAGRLAARGRATGIETELPMAGIWHVRDGRAVGLDIFPSLAEAKEAAGLDP